MIPERLVLFQQIRQIRIRCNLDVNILLTSTSLRKPDLAATIHACEVAGKERVERHSHGEAEVQEPPCLRAFVRAGSKKNGI